MESQSLMPNKIGKLQYILSHERCILEVTLSDRHVPKILGLFFPFAIAQNRFPRCLSVFLPFRPLNWNQQGFVVKYFFKKVS